MCLIKQRRFLGRGETQKLVQDLYAEIFLFTSTIHGKVPPGISQSQVPPQLTSIKFPSGLGSHLKGLET